MKTKTLEYTNGKTKFIGHLAGEDARGRARGRASSCFPKPSGSAITRRSAPSVSRSSGTSRSRRISTARAPCTTTWRSSDPSFNRFTRIGPSGARGRARHWMRCARKPGVDGARLAAIGYCFGGTTALELARTGAPLAAIATFHAGLIAELPEDAGRIRAKVLVMSRCRRSAGEEGSHRHGDDGAQARQGRLAGGLLRQCRTQLHQSGGGRSAGCRLLPTTRKPTSAPGS